jgi:hypothetical protein
MMNITFDYLTGNRKWLIRDYAIWGDSGALDIAMLATETDDSSKRVIFNCETTGGLAQIVEFTDLIDHRGNRLPDIIHNPAIIIISKSNSLGFLIGASGPTSFRIARVPGTVADSIVDLLIMEMN